MMVRLLQLSLLFLVTVTIQDKKKKILLILLCNKKFFLAKKVYVLAYNL